MDVDLKGKRIALIGGAGFIGHNLALKLKRLGAEPHVVDSLQVNNLGAFTHHLNDNPNDKLYVGFINERLALLRQADIPLHIVDARDYQLICPHLASINPHIVVQLAAIAHANRANKDPYAPSITRCALWRTRSTLFAIASRTSSSSRHLWSTATSRVLPSPKIACANRSGSTAR
jgi:hypothetical protein